MISVERSLCPEQGHCRFCVPSDSPIPPTASPGESDRAASAAQGPHGSRARAGVWLPPARLQHHAGDIPECHPDTTPSALPTVPCPAPAPDGEGTQSQEKRGSNPLTRTLALFQSIQNPPASSSHRPSTEAFQGNSRFTSAEMQAQKFFTQPRFQRALFSLFPISHEQDASPPSLLQPGQTLGGRQEEAEQGQEEQG